MLWLLYIESEAFSMEDWGGRPESNVLVTLYFPGGDAKRVGLTPDYKFIPGKLEK